MKNTMKHNTLVTLIITTLLALGTMQAAAVNYLNSYRGIQNTGYRVQTVSVTAPAATFRSTSAFSSPEWAEQPMLNSDGSVNERVYIGGPRRVIGSPDDDDEPDEGEGGGSNGEGQGGDNNWNGSDMPLGDAALPLALLACAYAIYKVSRRRKEA